MDKISYHHYTEFFMWLFELIAITVGILFAKKDRVTAFFLVYLIFDFVVLNINFYLNYVLQLDANAANKFIHLTNPLISLIELMVYYYYFAKLLNTRKVWTALNTLHRDSSCAV